MVSKADLSQPVSWASVSAAFDVVLDMPEALRAGELTRIGREDPLLARELESLLAHVSAQDDLLDRLSTSSEPGAQALDSLSCGTRVGAYRIVQLLGRGGMGEVYLAERADGQYDQKVALKLMRRDVAELSPAFQDERQLLARLEHPGIARLLDGGLDDYGRPFMVMELIKGQPISAWCRDHKTTLAERLRLFIAVCDTVAYAHRSLIVHRDLKPANVLVTVDGEVKLLDFGIAKLMQRMDEELIPAPSNHLTPGYAAPELFTEGTITTAADIYALGMLMFELLTDDRPWRSSAMPVIAALRKVIWEAPSLPSDFAQRASHAPFPPRLLKGDLDAIFAKATDRNPALRYAAAKDLADDVRAVLEHRPVQARKAARLYLLQRFLRRHWIPVSAATAVFIALTMGILGIGWEAAQAQREAARATSTKDFLISVFEASDPRVASDTPRGEITARNLLDLSADRIKSEFAADPAVEISLLGTVSAIYDLMGEQARSDRLRLEQVRAARAFYGETHPVVIEGQLDEISTSLHKVDAATATRRLDEVDSLIRRGHLERSVERARWWNLKGQTLWSDPLAVGARQTAFQNAATLYAKIDPINENYPVALNELGLTYMYYGNYRDAIKCFNTARTAAQSERIADDSVQVTIERNLAVALAYDDQRSEGEAALERGRLIGVRTYGVHNRHYWEVAAALAKMIHEDGDRQRADQLFTELVSEVPGNDADFESAVDRSVGAKVRETYGAALVAEGRVADGLALLESALPVYRLLARDPTDLPRLQLRLGDAYDRAGLSLQARASLQAALKEQEVQSDPSSEDLLQVRERWARFLLVHGDAPAAEVQLQEVMKRTDGRVVQSRLLAECDLAQLELQRSHRETAMQLIRDAAQLMPMLRGVRDVRSAPYAERVYAEILSASGDIDHARSWALKSLAESVQYDDPSSNSIEEVRRTLQAL